ncbi:MAG: SLBB domain-containing protein, partial [Terriglobus sp.]
YDLILHGDKSKDIRLQSGDTLFIPPVGPQVAIAGSVRHPAIYELSADSAIQVGTTLSDLLALAGGFAPTANPKDLRLERIDTDLQRHAMTIALNGSGKSMPLRDGDVLYVNHISPGFEKTVTIRGNLANPGRFAWTAGMRLNDIIPDRESLLTGDYWRERNRMGVPVPLFEPYEFGTPPPALGGATTDSSLMRAGISRTPDGQAKTSRDALTQVLPPSVPGQDTQDQQAALAEGGVQSNSAMELDRNATSEASVNRMNTMSPLLGTAQTGIAQTNNSQGLGNQQNGTTLNTALPNNALGQQRQQQQQPEQPVTATLPNNIIRIPAPEIDWSYAVIERLDPTSLKTTLVPFNLGKLVQDHDASQNLDLQPGDVVTILNQRDILVPQAEQTKFVRLEGEFPGAGVYSVKPGETLDELVKRAGGLTPEAYLFGSSFKRESTRVFQQQRLDEYITKLSADMDRQTAVRGASTQTGVSDPNALMLERNLVSQLRELRATGRVVFEFTPDSNGINAIPHIPLENGDVFRVPSRPSTVSVIGAVYGQNVFLYNEKRHLDDYLSLAGRTNRIADKSHAFIIRADGSIFSRQLAKGVLSNHFDDSRIYPGDAIVIPEKPISPSVTKQMLDYSQILSSFGLAVAALAVISGN